MEKELLYVAGLFDGEGCVEINKHEYWKNAKSTIYTMSLSLNNTHKPSVTHMKELFGGCVYKKTADKRQNRKPLWHWSVRAKQAEIVLKKLLPYLRIKKEQALIALKFRETFVNEWRPSQATLNKRNKYIEEIKNVRSRVFA